MTFEFDDEYEERLREYHDWLGDQADYWGDDALWYVDEEGVVQALEVDCPSLPVWFDACSENQQPTSSKPSTPSTCS